MIKLLTGSLLLLSLASCNNNADADKKTETDNSTTKTEQVIKNDLTEDEKKEGWKVLFDGQTTNGWHKYGGGAVGSAWKVTDGVIWLDTSSKKDGKVADGGDIVTDEDYDNFHLKLEWMISKNGNSGIMFYVKDDSTNYKKPYETGPEMQVLDNDGHADGKITKHRSGDLYDLISCSKETVKPVGEWNLAEIKCLNGKLDLYLNGGNVVSTTMWDDNWKKMVAGSKFKQWKDFGTFKSGKICLQDHDNTVWYRNVKVRKL
jgi:hypothetical protein